MEQNKGKEFRVSEIAEQTGIDIKNMSRYLKILEDQQQIKVRPLQEGRIRTKLISYTDPKKPQQLEPVPSPGPLPSPESLTAKSEPQDQRPPTFSKNAEPAPTGKTERHSTIKKLDLNQILLKLELMNEKDFPAYRTILKQYRTYQKKATLEELVNFINNEIL